MRRTTALVVALVTIFSIGWLMYFTPLDRQLIDHKSIAEPVHNLSALKTNLESNPLKLDSPTSVPFSAELSQDWVYDETDPVDFYSVGTSQHFLIYPATPFEVYERHIPLAEAGNASSMYLLSKVFYECRKAPASRESFEDHWLNSAPIQRFWALAEYQLGRCEDLRSQFDSDTDFHAQEDYWLHRSAEAGLLTARAELLMDMVEYPIEEDPFHEEIVQVVEKATQSEGYPAFYQMAAYLESLQGYSVSDDITATAWRFAGCKLQKGCDHRKTFQLVTDGMLEPRIDEFLELVEQIEQTHPVTGSQFPRKTLD